MYFDYAATTPIDDDILNLYVKIQKEYYANTTSLHKFGLLCNNIYEESKNNINKALRTNHEIIYTSNATEANNLCLLGYLKNKKGKVITTKIEHPSVLEVLKQIENIEIIYLNCDSNGVISLDELKKNLSDDCLLVSIMWVNNIVGSIQPIKDVIEILKNYKKIKFHCDIVQGITKIKPNFEFSQIDFLVLSAHKFYGPKGVGCLLYKKNIMLDKIMFGSSSQNGIKPGTFDLGLVVCLCKALIKNLEKQEEHFEYVQNLNKMLLNNLKSTKIIRISNDNCSPFIISFSLLDLLSETTTRILEEKDIFISSGSACNSKQRKPEKTVLAMTKNEKYALSAIRVSLSHKTSIDEVINLANILNKIGE